MPDWENIEVDKPIKRSIGIPATDDEVRNAYFWWLCDRVDLSGEEHARIASKDPKHPTYFMLAIKLLNEEFVPLIPNDDNRAADGMNLRYHFSTMCSSFADYSAIEGPCSLLEMLVALAARIDRDIMQGPDDPDRSIKWFWEMITNLGLADYSDDSIDLEKAESVRTSIDNFLCRNIESNGEGGLFPLAHPDKDQRTVELWYQMQAYLIERYS